MFYLPKKLLFQHIDALSCREIRLKTKSLSKLHDIAFRPFEQFLKVSRSLNGLVFGATAHRSIHAN